MLNNLDLASLKAAAEQKKATRKRPNALMPFPQKLHKMLTDVEQEGFDHIVSWLGASNAFRIHDPVQFVKQIMPRYFKQSHIRSCQRQFNNYGFKRIIGGPLDGAYQHPKFVQGKPELAKQIIRIAALNNANKSIPPSPGRADASSSASARTKSSNRVISKKKPGSNMIGDIDFTMSLIVIPERPEVTDARLVAGNRKLAGATKSHVPVPNDGFKLHGTSNNDGNMLSRVYPRQMHAHNPTDDSVHLLGHEKASAANDPNHKYGMIFQEDRNLEADNRRVQFTTTTKSLKGFDDENGSSSMMPTLSPSPYIVNSRDGHATIKLQDEDNVTWSTAPFARLHRSISSTFGVGTKSMPKALDPQESEASFSGMKFHPPPLTRLMSSISSSFGMVMGSLRSTSSGTWLPHSKDEDSRGAPTVRTSSFAAAPTGTRTRNSAGVPLSSADADKTTTRISDAMATHAATHRFDSALHSTALGAISSMPPPVGVTLSSSCLLEDDDDYDDDDDGAEATNNTYENTNGNNSKPAVAPTAVFDGSIGESRSRPRLRHGSMVLPPSSGKRGLASDSLPEMEREASFNMFPPMTFSTSSKVLLSTSSKPTRLERLETNDTFGREMDSMLQGLKTDGNSDIVHCNNGENDGKKQVLCKRMP